MATTTKRKPRKATTKKSPSKPTSTNKPTKRSTASTRTRSVGTTQDPANLDQVRDILFGSQAREFNDNLARLEERFSKASAAAEKETANRIDSLELYVKHELAALVDRLNLEQAKRDQATKELGKQIKTLGREMRGAMAKLDQRLEKLDATLSKSERSLRQHVLDEAKNLRQNLAAKHAEQSQALERQVGLLRDVKVDRAALKDLFSELAVRITDGPESASVSTGPRANHRG